MKKKKTFLYLCLGALICAGALVGASVADLITEDYTPPATRVSDGMEGALVRESAPVPLGPSNVELLEAAAEASNNAGVESEEFTQEQPTKGTNMATGTEKPKVLMTNVGTPIAWTGGYASEWNPASEGSRALSFDLSPGTGAPPDTLGGYPMTDFPLDESSSVYDDITSIPSPCSVGGNIEFSTSMSHRRIGDGWATWSHGYTEDVYYSNGAVSVTITVPTPACAFYFYVEPNPFAEHYFTAVGDDGTSSGSFSAHGSAGAVYVGIYGAGLQSVNISTDDGVTDFAVGEFGIGCICEDVFGACCDPYTAGCIDNVEALDCVPPLQWTFDTLCDDLYPPCGNPGACCDVYTGYCEDPVLEVLCDYVRFESGEQCEELEPECGTPGCCCFPEDGETVTDPYVEFAANCEGRFLPGVVGGDCVSTAFVPECGLWTCEGVLYAPSEADNPGFREAVSDILGQPVDYFDARYDTPSVEFMEPYCAVMTWANYAYSDNVLFGDNLADYVDLNGRVILGQWTLPTAGNYLSGEIMTSAYCPATASSYAFAGTYQGDGYQCEHVLGVSAYDTQYRDLASAISGAVTDGTFEDGYPAVIWRSDRLVHQSAGNLGGLYSTGDWAQLTANMVICTDDPLVGACCDPYTGICVDDEPSADCAPPLQFFYQQTCASLDPPCGNPGACCYDLTEEGDCFDDILEANCAGTRFEPLPATCDDFVPACGEMQFIFVLDPGTGPPPPTQCGCPMTDFPLDDSSAVYDDITSIPSPCEAGGEIEFSTAVSHRRIGSGWASWSHGYTEDVYYTNGATQITITLPVVTRCGFYMYIEPNPFAEHSFKLIANGVIESDPFTAHGSAGATYAGVCGEGLETITVVCTSGVDFAIGEFGICCYCTDVYGACCDPYDDIGGVGYCEDNIEVLDCQPPLQWSYQTSCEGTFPPDDPWPALYPPCGNPGACCDIFTGECADPVLELLCEYDRFEGGEQCDELEPTCGTPGCCCFPEDGETVTDPYVEWAANCEGRFLPGVLGDDCVADAFDPPCGLWTCSGMMYAPANPDNLAFRNALSAMLGQPVDYFDVRTATPTVDEMAEYCAVLTWANYAYADKVLMGDRLAEYVDDGGKAILGQWCLPTAGNYLAGEIMADGYCPATASSYTYYGAYQDDGTDCVHCMVNEYEPTYRDLATAEEGAETDGTFIDGKPAVIWRPDRRVYYSAGHTGNSFSYVAGDYERLTANMVQCTGAQAYGACCDPTQWDPDDPWGLCNDEVECNDCPPPLQFYLNGNCAGLDPLCGIPGACCIDNPPPEEPPPGECTVELKVDCEGRHAYGEECDPDPFVPPCGEYTACTHSITMWDDYGDGWNGGFIDVYVDGNLVLAGVTILTGAGPETVSFEAGTNSEITTVWTPGGWPYECSYCIYDGFEKEICCDGLGGVDPTGITCLGNCEPPAGRCCLEYDGCQVIPEADCEDLGGIYDGDDTDCGDFADCDGDGMTDLCAIDEYGAKDCNKNGIPDSCDVADCGECLAPCDENAWCQDCQGDGVPDGCQLGPWCGDGTCSGAEDCVTCPEDCGECPPGCVHSITMWDSFGDGWNGCTIDVYVNDELALGGATIVSGAGPETVYFDADTGDTIFVDFTCVSWCTEPSYCVYDGFGQELGCATGGYVEPEGDLTVAGNCEEPSDSGNCCWDHCEEGPGCDDPVCEAAVCSYDSFCCTYCWDGICAMEAQSDPSCVCDGRDGELLISQPPNQSNGIFSDCDCDFCGQPQVLVENFILDEDIGIETVRFWGGFYPSDHEPANDWRIRFYYDDGGVAGDEIAFYSGAGAQEQTGITLFGVHEWVVDYTIDPPLELTAGTYHVACYADSLGDSDSWFWEVGNYDSEHGVPGQGYGFVCPPEYPYYDSATDMAFELYGKSGPPINDCNTNCVPDSCDLDCNGNGIPDDCEEEPVACGNLIIKGGACPAPFNRKSHGVTPMWLVGTEFFDVMDVDLSSVRLSRADGVGGEVAPLDGPPGPKSHYEDMCQPYVGEGPCACLEDVSVDGIMDIKMKFSSDEMTEVLELDGLAPGAIVVLVITGDALGPCGGQTFTATTDCIRLVPPGCSGGELTVESSVAGAYVDVGPLDETLDGGGFADFQRMYPLGTEVTVTAEESASGCSLRGWYVGDFLWHRSSVTFTFTEDMTVKAVYDAAPPWSHGAPVVPPQPDTSAPAGAGMLKISDGG